MKREVSFSLDHAASAVPRTASKHKRLVQDYDDLLKETELIKKKLKTMKEKRNLLFAEVKFLRRRHQFLKQNQYSDHGDEDLVMQHRRDKRGTKGDNICQVSCHDLNNRGGRLVGSRGFMAEDSPVVDLNMISMGENLLTGGEGTSKAMKCSTRFQNELQNSVHFSACRSEKSRPGNGGKRKITWQDHVALRV